MGLVPIDITELIGETGMNPVQYQYFNQLINHRTIVLNDSMDECIVESVILPLKVFEEDNDNITPVTLILNSPGGMASASLPLLNIIDNYKKPLNIITFGYAYSMGTLLLCSGNKNPNVKKMCYPFSTFLFHAGSLTASGETNGVRDYMDFAEQQDEQIKKYIFANTNITEEQWDKMSRREHYFDAQRAREYGLINEIIGEAAPETEEENNEEKV